MFDENYLLHQEGPLTEEQKEKIVHVNNLKNEGEIIFDWLESDVPYLFHLYDYTLYVYNGYSYGLQRFTRNLHYGKSYTRGILVTNENVLRGLVRYGYKKDLKNMSYVKTPAPVVVDESSEKIDIDLSKYSKIKEYEIHVFADDIMILRDGSRLFYHEDSPLDMVTAGPRTMATRCIKWGYATNLNEYEPPTQLETQPQTQTYEHVGISYMWLFIVVLLLTLTGGLLAAPLSIGGIVFLIYAAGKYHRGHRKPTIMSTNTLTKLYGCIVVILVTTFTGALVLVPGLNVIVSFIVGLVLVLFIPIIGSTTLFTLNAVFGYLPGSKFIFY